MPLPPWAPPCCYYRTDRNGYITSPALLDDIAKLYCAIDKHLETCNGPGESYTIELHYPHLEWNRQTNKYEWKYGPFFYVVNFDGVVQASKACDQYLIGQGLDPSVVKFSSSCPNVPRPNPNLLNGRLAAGPCNQWAQQVHNTMQTIESMIMQSYSLVCRDTVKGGPSVPPMPPIRMRSGCTRVNARGGIIDSRRRQLPWINPLT